MIHITNANIRKLFPWIRPARTITIYHIDSMVIYQKLPGVYPIAYPSQPKKAAAAAKKTCRRDQTQKDIEQNHQPIPGIMAFLYQSIDQIPECR